MTQTTPPRWKPRRLCLQCGYPLEGLESDECPECGLAFSPSDPTTFRDTLAPSNARLRFSPFMGVCFSVLMFVSLFTLQWAFISYWHDTTTLLWFNASSCPGSWWELNGVGRALGTVQITLFGVISIISGRLVTR